MDLKLFLLLSQLSWFSFEFYLKNKSNRLYVMYTFMTESAAMQQEVGIAMYMKYLFEIRNFDSAKIRNGKTGIINLGYMSQIHIEEL